MFTLERDEAGVRLKPIFVILPECSKVGLFGTRGVGDESLVGLFQDRPAQDPLGSVINEVGWQSSQFDKIIFLEVVLPDQRLQIQEVGISGKCREALIW